MFETEGFITNISQTVEYREHFHSINFLLNYQYVISDNKFPIISEQKITWSINSKEENVLILYDF